jgi:hypothetical protein
MANRAPGHLRDWPCAASIHERNLSEGMPPSWLFLTYDGCTMEAEPFMGASRIILLHFLVGGLAAGVQR